MGNAGTTCPVTGWVAKRKRAIERDLQQNDVDHRSQAKAETAGWPSIGLRISCRGSKTESHQWSRQPVIVRDDQKSCRSAGVSCLQPSPGQPVVGSEIGKNAEMKTIGALFETPVQEEVWSRTSSPNSSGRRVRSV